MITDVSQIAAAPPRGDAVFAARDAFLKRPTRAVGGEPCVECGEPIDPKANWKTRDRHLCGKPNCNRRAKKRFHQAWEAGQIVDPTLTPQRVQVLSAEWLREPRLFTTTPNEEFPFEIGMWTKHGDVVERFGQSTVYLNAEQHELGDVHLDHWSFAADGGEGGVQIAFHVESGLHVSYPVDRLGRATNMMPGNLTFDGDEYRLDWHLGLAAKLIVLDSVQVWLARELVRDVDENGDDFDWWVWTFTPAPMPEIMWTPAREARSQQRSRISRARGAYLARMRAIGYNTTGADYLDPAEVFARDEWMCGICGSEIDATLAYPDPFSVSLDHIEPVSAGGAHTAENTRAAHLSCNIARGARSD